MGRARCFFLCWICLQPVLRMTSSSVLGTFPLRTRILVLPWTTTRWVVFLFIMKDLVDENPVELDADGHPSWMELRNEPVN